MKSLSVLFVLGAVILFNPNAEAQRGGDGPTRGSSSSGETRGSSDGGSSRGSSGDTRSSSSSSSSGSDYGSSSSSSSDYGSSSSSDYGSYGGSDGYYGGGGGGRSRVRVVDFHVGQKVELISTGDKGVITFIKRSLFKNYVCIEFDVDHTEECGFKASMIKAI